MKKIMLMPIFVFLALLFSSFSVYALSCGFQNPTTASGGIFDLGDIVNISFGNTGGIASTRDAIRIYVNISSSFTANSSTSTTIGFNINSTNGTQNKDSVNISLDNIGNVILEDGQSYTLNCYCENRTTSDTVGAGSVACNSTRTGVRIDRTVPQIPTSLTTAERLDGDAITATVNGANTTKCTISFGLGGIRSAMTHSGNTCTYTIAPNSPSDGVYQYQVFASDDLNETASAVTSIEIDALGNPSRRSPSNLGLQQSPITTTTNRNVNFQQIIKILLVVVVVDLIFGMGLIFKKK